MFERPIFDIMFSLGCEKILVFVSSHHVIQIALLMGTPSILVCKVAVVMTSDIIPFKLLTTDETMSTVFECL